MMKESKKESKDKYEFKRSRFIILVVTQIIMAVFGFCAMMYLPSVFYDMGIKDDVGPHIGSIYFLCALIVTILSGTFISHWIREYIMADLIAITSWMALWMIAYITSYGSSLLSVSAIIAGSLFLAAVYVLFQMIVLAIIKVIKAGSIAKFIDI